MGITLEKGKPLSLSKLNLDKSSSLTSVRLGLGWDPLQAAPQKQGFFGRLMGGGSSHQADNVDLDASALLLDASGNILDQVWFQQLQSGNGAVSHSGDNLTGEGEGDDETISVDLSRIPSQVQAIAFTVHSFRGQQFGAVQGAGCRLLDNNGRELAKYQLSTQSAPLSSATAMLMAVLKRRGNEWEVTALGEAMQGRTFKDNLNDIRRLTA